ncbi:gamma-glutamylcyclotransferase [Hoeflea sp. YIM 152468]|uniref:gamma-glutamylcyclotransferase n=1 Tax=Hoeflea sp. YIM 152468 TaxID=3031759 RepID=UPI0023DB46EB|nr:gamma-glutamylcyclotransferase [Hoeflea sp. YIM 152468]MDF1608056.1 gamma-glutamylcyclotransferase [Hoeflea sp. YIM 152468]
MDEFWVFGYGSLMWRPGFDHEETRQARLFGYHRALCVRSFVHRGTPDRPGLVLGLDRGGSCHGVAFRVRQDLRDAVIGYLRQRELATHVYLETTRKVRLDSGEDVRAVTYVVDRSHQQYAGALSVDDALARVSGAVGQSGPNEEYVINTAAHLRTLGLRDEHLESIAARLRLGERIDRPVSSP